MKSFTKAMILGMAAERAQAATSCKALALSGGGSLGAYEAGIIYGLMHEGNPQDFEWDVVTGVSAGAINAAAVSVFDKADG